MAILSRGQITLVNMGDMMDLIDQHIAYAWSPDGKDRFTRNWSENLLRYSNKPIVQSASGRTSFTPSYGDLRNVFVNDGKGIILEQGEKYTLSFKYNIANYNNPKLVSIGFGLGMSNTVGEYSADTYAIAKSYETASGQITYTFTANNSGGKYPYFAMRSMRWKADVKFESTETNIPSITITELSLVKSTGNDVYVTNPQDDYDNAVPRYIGRSLKDSNNPVDYTWEPNPERKPWTSYAQGLNGEGFSLMPYGENELGKSDTFESAILAGGVSIISDTYNGHKIVKSSTNSDTSTSSYRDMFSYEPSKPLTGLKYTASFMAKSLKGNRIFRCYFYNPNTTIYGESSVGTTSKSTDGGIDLIATVQWTRYYVTWTQSEPANSGKRLLIGRIYGEIKSGEELLITEPKLELANTMGIPTPWTPAPSEDPLGAIPKYVGTAALPYEDPYKYEWKLNPDWLEVNTETIVTDKYSQSVQDLDGFKNTVGATYQTKNAMTGYYNKAETNSQINQKAGEITSTVSSTYTTKSDFNTGINNAATDATTKANNALASAKTDATTKANDAKAQAVSLAKTETTSQVKQLSDSITSTVSSTYATIKSVEKVSDENGENQWLCNKYNNHNVRKVLTEEDIADLTVDETFTVKDADRFSFDGDYFWLHMCTYLYVSESKTFEMKAIQDDGLSISINNSYVYKTSVTTGSFSSPFSIVLNKGWNKVDIYFNELSGSATFSLSSAFLSLSDRMNCFVSLQNETVSEYKMARLKQDLSGFQLGVSATYETKANVATNLNTAKSYADTQANNAKTSAINTASGDATTKANNAKTAAVSESKTYTDAQLKITSDSITSTVSKVEEKVDGIQIGNRNYISEKSWTTNGYVNTNGSISYNGGDVASDYILIGKNKYWCAQIFEFPTAGISCFAFYDESKALIGSSILIQKNMSGEIPSSAFWLRISTPRKEKCGGRYKFEFGNKPTDWTPAPEDIDVNINNALTTSKEYTNSQIEQTAESIKSTVSANYTTQNDFNSLKNKTDWKIITSAQNLNNLTTTGKYWLQVSGNTNAPSSAWLYVSVDAPRSDRIKQTVQQDSSVSGYWERTYNGSWSGWRKMSDESWVSSQITQTAESINSTVSQKVGKSEVISTINQSAESVTINASKINLQGALTISQFSTSDRDKINNGISTANTANSAASTAQNRADSAYSLANTANGTANTANNQINSWKKSGTTKIDGGNIYADSLSVITGNMGNLRINGEISGYSGSSRVSLLNYNSLNFYETDGSNNFKLSPSGITNINSGYGTRNLVFFSEGMAISPGSSNTGVTKNSGIRLLGNTSYIDLFSDKSSSGSDYSTRLIAESSGNGGINNNKGQFYINANSIALNANVGVTGTLSMNGYSIVGAGNTIGTTGTGGWNITMMNIQGITGTPYLNVTSGSRSWGVNMWTSDMKLKKNIAKTKGKALDIVDKLMVRQFDWREYDRHTDFGLIAQNVERVLPQAVFNVEQRDSQSVKQISADGVIPVLVQAIQELQQEIKQLKLQ